MTATDDTTGPDGHEAELAARGEALIATAVADVRAPLSLRERIEHERTRTAPARRRRRTLLGLSFAGAAAAVLLAVALVVPGGTPGAPTVVEAAELGTKPPEEAAPGVDPANPALLTAARDGVEFPDWQAEFKWTAEGLRTDEVEGRDATTVFYANPKGVAVAYTIVGGEALDAPEGAPERTVGGITFRVVRDGGRQVVTWEREGRTCVVSAPAAFDTAKLLEVAAWKGGGAVSA